MRALWQSFLDPEPHERYFQRLRSLLSSVAPEIDFDVVGIRPPDRHLHALTEVRCGVAALRNALYAENEGYGAIVMGHFQEPLLREIRLAVTTPVIGLGESCLLTARGRLGLIAISDVFVPWHEEQVRGYGLDDRLVGVRSIDTQPDDFMASMDGGSARSKLRGIVESAASALRTAGAETILPAGALIPVALWDERDPFESGSSLVNCVAVAAKAAIEASPHPESVGAPPRALAEFLEATGGQLLEPVR